VFSPSWQQPAAWSRAGSESTVASPKQRRPDITRARTILGWEPKVALEEELLKTVERAA
jgi:nucleoside-diphosphate-sugar epimerase